MAKKELVTKVWIEEGCIVCDACETTAPDVFEVLDDTCIIRPEALSAEFTKPRTEAIVDAAEECPVDVIKFDIVTVEAKELAAAAPDGATLALAEAAVGDVAAKAQTDGLDEAVPAAPSKSPEKPAVAAKAPESKAKPVPAGEPDPAIQALLRAATARGGNAGILRRTESLPAGVAAWRRKPPRDLPPDAKQARILEEARKAGKDPNLQRREFIGGAALAVGWTALGIGVGVSAGPAFGRFMMPNVLEEPDPRIRVGKIQKYAEMAPGDVNEDYKPQGIWMIRQEGRVAALNIICTHLGCIPNWLANDRKFKCPCHGSGYQPDGINFEGPTPRPLERFRIFLEEGQIVVDKSKKYQYELGQWDLPGSYLEV